MVGRIWRNRRGASSRGCLVSLLLLVVALYYGVNIGEVYYRNFQLQGEMRSQARLAPSLTDAVILRRLRAKVEEIGLPDEALHIRIRRIAATRRIHISTEYQESVDLPFFNHTFILKPSAEAPL